MAENEVTPVVEQIVGTGSESVDDRIAAAAMALGDDEQVAPTEPAPSSEDAKDEQPEPKEGQSQDKAKAADDAEQKKPRNMLRDVAAEWATARRMQQANTKRAQELEARQQQIEQEAATAREVATLMRHNPIAAAERVAQLAGISPHEYLQRLQLAYINGDDSQQRPQQDAAIANEVAQLRAELYAERNRREQEEQARYYQQQVAEVTTTETQNLVGLAKAYADQFPALQHLSDDALTRRVNDAVQFYVSRGDEVGRFEVLSAVNNIVNDTLAEYGLADSLKQRVASAPAPNGGKRQGTNAAPTRQRNGSGRYIPTNAAAAEGGAPRRAMTVEERLAEATKVLWSAD